VNKENYNTISKCRQGIFENPIQSLKKCYKYFCGSRRPAPMKGAAIGNKARVLHVERPGGLEQGTTREKISWLKNKKNANFQT